MQYFSGGKIGRVFMLRLDPGDDVLPCLQKMIDSEGIDCGVVVSGIGTFDNSKLHMVETCGFPPVEFFAKTAGLPLELCVVQGIIANGAPHLHAVISDKRTAVGGHLEPDNTTLYLCELVILEVLDMPLARQMNDQGVNQLSPKK